MKNSAELDALWKIWVGLDRVVEEAEKAAQTSGNAHDQEVAGIIQNTIEGIETIAREQRPDYADLIEKFKRNKSRN